MIPAIFKKWFSKQNTDCSKDSKDTLESLKAYIILGVDGNDNNFVVAHFNDDEYQKMVNLLFLLVSGQVVEEVLVAVQKDCKDNSEIKLIVDTLTQLITWYENSKVDTLSTNTDRAVVDPTEVFYKGERNEFKG